MKWMCARVLAVALVAIAAAPGFAQKPLTPTEATLGFYGMMRQHKYKEGFALSIYAEAVDGLTEQDLSELEPEFEKTAADIPDTIEVRGEQISGDAATVFAKFGTAEEIQEVTLVKDGGRWLVGDRESLEQVRREKNAFFFNARIRVDHNEAFDLIRRITGTEDVHFQSKKSYATLDELVANEGFADDLKDGVASGYRFVVNLTPDRQSFTVVAVPVRYGRTGKLSFFSDSKTIHAADAAGSAVNEQAPVLVEDVFRNDQAEP